MNIQTEPIKCHPPKEVKQIMEQFGNMSDDELRKEIRKLLNEIAANFIKIAGLIRVYEERGNDVKTLAIDFPVIHYIRMISLGQLDADAFKLLMYKRPLLQKVCVLPITDQRRLATGEKIPVVTRDEAGIIGTRWLPVNELSQQQAARVLTPEGVMSEARQRTIVEERPPKPREAKLVSSDPNWAVVPRKGVYVIRGTEKIFISIEVLDEMTRKAKAARG